MTCSRLYGADSHQNPSTVHAVSDFFYLVHCASFPMIKQGDLGKDYTSKPKCLSPLG